MNARAACRLAEGVAMRREPFGGLLYRYDDRRLYVIQSSQLMEFVAELDGTRPLQDAAAAFSMRQPGGASSTDTLLRMVEQLESIGLVEAVRTD